MKPPRTQASNIASVNMTPMIDIVFLLVIFFLVSSHLVHQENMVELALPIAASGQDDRDTETPRVTLSIQDNGRISLAGREIDPSLLAGRLSELRKEEGDNLEVRIRAARQQPYSAASPVMLACTKAGIWNVTWSVYRNDPGR